MPIRTTNFGKEAQTEITEKSGLFESKNVKFVEDSASLLLDLGVLFYSANSVINDEKRLKSSAIDYRRLALLKNIVVVNKGNTPVLMARLNTHLSFIQQYDKTLAELISNYLPNLNRQKELLSKISNLIQDAEQMLANIDILMENIERLPNSDLKLRLKSRIVMLKRYSEEIRVLNFDLYDIKNWGRYFHEDLKFFVDRVNTFFKGGVTRDRIRFISLDQFDEEKMKRNITSSQQFRVLFSLSRYTHDTQAQIEYLSKLILFLEKDIEDGKWIRNLSTSKFYNNVEAYADIFRKRFFNEPFAKSLLANKQKIGEQPFKWIELLQKMKQGLEASMPKKNVAIENLMNLLSNLFSERITALRSSILKFANEMVELLQKETQNKDLLKLIEDGVKRMEKTINRIWEERKRKFNEFANGINLLSKVVNPSLDQFTQQIDIERESAQIARDSMAFVQFWDTTLKINRTIPRASVQKRHGLSGMLAFNIARMEELVESNNAMEARIKQKDELARTFPLDRVKTIVVELIGVYQNLMRFIEFLGIGVETKNLEAKTKIFLGEFNG